MSGRTEQGDSDRNRRPNCRRSEVVADGSIRARCEGPDGDQAARFSGVRVRHERQIRLSRPERASCSTSRPQISHRVLWGSLRGRHQMFMRPA